MTTEMQKDLKKTLGLKPKSNVIHETAAAETYEQEYTSHFHENCN